MIVAAVGDAARNGESRWGVVLGFGLGLAVLAGTILYLLRAGRANVSVRTARLMKWVAPLAIVVAGLRVIAWMVSRP